MQLGLVDPGETDIIVRNPPIVLSVKKRISPAIGQGYNARDPDDTSASLAIEAFIS